MHYTIRDITPDDYDTISALHTAAYPASTLGLDPVSLRHIDASLRGKYNLRRFMLEGDGLAAGTAHFYNMISLYHPQKFFVSVTVHPDHRRQGLGQRLYDHLMENLRPFDPLRLIARIREDMTSGCRFLEKRGFRVTQREWESSVALDRFDPAQYADVTGRVADQGIVICDLNALRERPGWESGLYELIIHIQADMPMSDTYTPIPFDDFLRLSLANPRLIPEGYFVALDGDRPVGVSILQKDLREASLLHTDDTGVYRDYRRRGIALALKAHALTWAKNAGYDHVRTVNESTNRSMLTINERMGFVKFPAWLGHVLDLKTDQ